MKVYLIRHGESINNIIEENDPHNYYYLRVKDPELSPAGINQAQSLTTRMKNLHINKGKT